MGLIKATFGAIGSTLHDQWKEVISCENMSNDILMMAKSTDTGVITKKSAIRVMPGQCAVIMQDGKVLDATAEEGDYTFDESASPSFFAGDFGAVFKEMWERFTYGGKAANRQTIYFFNTKEIMDNKFGTATPIPFQDWSHPVPNQMTGGMLPLSVKVKCFGKYTFKVVDPALFMKEIAGTATIYKKDQITEQIRAEVISAFQNILNEMGTEKYKIPVLELPSQTDEIKQIMDERIYDEQVRRRGLSIVGFAIESVSLDEKSEQYIQNYILSANANMQQGTLTGAYADAVRDAANNSNGSANGFMGVGMMNMTSGNAFGSAVGNAGSNANYQTPSNNTNTNSTDSWNCECGATNTGKFCQECGKSRPASKFCPNCGNKINGTPKFCPECGEKLQ